jgi:hypothetical protein
MALQADRRRHFEGSLAMHRPGLMLALLFGLGAFALTAPPVIAQDAAVKKSAEPKAGPGQKVCRYRFPTGERRTWVCKKEEPCCAWDAIKYVKCGSTITGCL